LVSERGLGRFPLPSGFPALLDWSGGCGTRASHLGITSDLAGVLCLLSRMANSSISPRRNPRHASIQRRTWEIGPRMKLRTKDLK
jgi:hypothetical protein